MSEQDEKMQYPGAAAVTGLKIPTLQSMVCRRQIPHYRLGRRLVVFSRTELLAWMAERRVDLRRLEAEVSSEGPPLPCHAPSP